MKKLFVFILFFLIFLWCGVATAQEQNSNVLLYPNNNITEEYYYSIKNDNSCPTVELLNYINGDIDYRYKKIEDDKYLIVFKYNEYQKFVLNIYNSIYYNGIIEYLEHSKHCLEKDKLEMLYNLKSNMNKKGYTFNIDILTFDSINFIPDNTTPNYLFFTLNSNDFSKLRDILNYYNLFNFLAHTYFEEYNKNLK